MLRYRNKPLLSEQSKIWLKTAEEHHHQRKRVERRHNAIEILWLGLIIALGLRLIVAVFQMPSPVAEVGDQLAFHSEIWKPRTVVIAQAHVLTGAWASPTRVCSLDRSEMSSPGGTATVLAVHSDGVILDWVGGNTSSGSGNCGNQSEIFVSNADYVKLLNAQIIHDPPYRR